ncbi:hypothetical protein C1646_766531 [Rhizophagus diaphanus]|nr:hypothetical protein C1646_766531 [Rhizophagus diaphanus] [Rhizophagus sp. MUCL 43196]
MFSTSQTSKSANIYGGYNPLQFTHSNGQNSYTTDNFIFSFENSGDIQNMKISHTLYMSGQYIYFDGSGYYDGNVLNPYLNSKFIPEEIEVFKLSLSSS